MYGDLPHKQLLTVVNCQACVAHVCYCMCCSYLLYVAHVLLCVAHCLMCVFRVCYIHCSLLIMCFSSCVAHVCCMLLTACCVLLMFTIYVLLTACYVLLSITQCLLCVAHVCSMLLTTYYALLMFAGCCSVFVMHCLCLLHVAHYSFFILCFAMCSLAHCCIYVHAA